MPSSLRFLLPRYHLQRNVTDTVSIPGFASCVCHSLKKKPYELDLFLLILQSTRKCHTKLATIHTLAVLVSTRDIFVYFLNFIMKNYDGVLLYTET